MVMLTWQYKNMHGSASHSYAKWLAFYEIPRFAKQWPDIFFQVYFCNHMPSTDSSLLHCTSCHIHTLLSTYLTGFYI